MTDHVVWNTRILATILAAHIKDFMTIDAKSKDAKDRGPLRQTTEPSDPKNSP